MTIYTDPRLLAGGWVGGTLSRHYGNMRETAAQTPVYEQLGIDPQRILHFKQIHSDKIVEIPTAAHAQTVAQGPIIEADGWIMAPDGWGVAIITADCVPLFVWSAQGPWAALAHCGWRGVVQGLPGKVAATLREKDPQAKLYAWLGPHIQACCFEVQEDVAAQFPASCVERREGKLFINLTAEIRCQLTQAGVSPEDICAPHYCTCGDSKNFFSWRRDHKKNLLLSFLYRP